MKETLSEKRKQERDQKRREREERKAKKKNLRPKMEDIFKKPPKKKSTKNTRAMKLEDDLWNTMKVLKHYGAIKSITNLVSDSIVKGISDIEMKLRENGYDLEVLRDMYEDEADIKEYMDYVDKEEA
jgi:hypothetical protein